MDDALFYKGALGLYSKLVKNHPFIDAGKTSLKSSVFTSIGDFPM